jgi:RecA-superfamily ATPases implicated in signal transduction
LCRFKGDDKAEAIHQVLVDAKKMSPSSGVQKIIEDTISGKAFNVPFPFPTLTKYGQCLLPETITILCGDPGDGKSFFLLQSLIHWQQQGYPVVCQMLERSQDYHLYRALAQVSGNSKITDREWMVENDENKRITRETFKKHRDTLDVISKTIEVSPTRMNLRNVADWIEKKAAEGMRVIAVDPITKASTGQNRHIEDEAFCDHAGRIAKKYQCSIIVVTHPKAGTTKRSLDACAGGTCYERFSDNMLWMQRLPVKKKWTSCAGKDWTSTTSTSPSLNLYCDRTLLNT